MQNLSKNLFKLVKSGYLCKVSIKKYLKHADSSSCYRLAKYYDEQFLALQKRSSLTVQDVERLNFQLAQHRAQNNGGQDALRLLSSVESFLQALTPLVSENIA